MSPTPSISIIVPTYQRRDLVCDALRALFQQSYDGPIEFIVVIDGSTDGTAEAIGRLRAPQPLRLIQQPNRGQAAARNRGARDALGDILLFLDDDMTCEPDLVRQHASLYRDGADAVVGNIPLHGDSPPDLLTKNFATASVWEQRSRLTPFEIYSGQLSVRKSVFAALGGFDERFCAAGSYGNEDVEFGARLLDRYQVRHNPRAISHQLNVISAQQFMDRASELAHADLLLAAKLPELGRELFARRAGPSRLRRIMYRMGSASPAFAGFAADAMVRLCELALATRFRSNGLLARGFFAAHSIAYWSRIRSLSGGAVVRQYLRL